MAYRVPATGAAWARQALHRAFSLFELLVVIAIIAVLLSFLLAAVLGAKHKARQAQCAHNVRQLGFGLEQFLTDYHVYPMFANYYSKERYPEHHGNWITALQYEGLSAAKPNNRFYEEGVWSCPAAPRPSSFPTNGLYGSYGYNAFGLNPGRTDLWLGLGGHRTSDRRLFTPPVAESEVSQPGNMMAVGESFTGGITFSRENLEDLNRALNASARHQGKASVLFCDGHVEIPSLKFLFSDTNDAALSRWNRDNQPHR